MNKNLYKLAIQLRKTIGAHAHLIGKHGKHNEYYIAQSESDKAVSLAKYLIWHLQDRHQAEHFAHMVGMPGYLHMMR